MSGRTRIKICGITRVADGVAAARAGADAIGVVFWRGTPRCVSHDQARAIVGALPPFVGAVGLFVDPAPDEVRAALAAVPLEWLQFHGAEAPELCRSFGRPYLKAIAVKEGVDLLEYAARYEDAAGLLFDAYREGDLPGGTGHAFDWTRLSVELRRALKPPIVLSGGLDPDNVGRAIRDIAPWAVDVSSGVEARGADGKPQRGLKDHARIAAFVQGVRNADGGPP
ncbi:MAG: phosphoribosylanthranilate isomerase [Casimicrobiaceae bacterium]